MCSNFYITTPIYYVTARPHLGSLYSTVLADIFARWHQVLGQKTCMVTGTDEHGQKVAAAAAAAGMEPRAFVDSFIEAFQETWKRYHIEYTTFIRTTDPHHYHAVIQWIEQLMRQGDIYRGSYEGFYCTPCETFVMEREQEGIAGEVPRCASCQRATQRTSETCYFFRLSAYQDRLLEFYAARPDFIIPRERMAEVVSFVKSGLRDLAISRARSSVSWGIPFPGDDTQVVYVWADALNNYLSAIGYADPQRCEEFAQWWPAQVQVLGKDIVRFHAVYWPAFLMAAGLQVPQHLLVHGWIQVNGEKMSKSLGNVVDPHALADRFGVDAVRYYLARHLAVTHDAPFSLQDVTTRINADLADDLGNLVQRLTTIAVNRECERLDLSQETGELDVDRELYAQVYTHVRAAAVAYADLFLHKALAELWQGIARVNAYLHAQEPWKLPRDQQQRIAAIIRVATRVLVPLSGMIWPVMPGTMARLAERLGISSEQLKIAARATCNNGVFDYALLCNLQKGDALFPKLREEVLVHMPARELAAAERTVASEQHSEAYIGIELFGQVDMRVGTIVQVELVPKSEKLYKLTVDAGSFGVRTICSGVRAHFSPAELIGKQGIFVANLAPRVMVGIPSQGMMLFAEDASGKLQLVGPQGLAVAGAKVR